MNVLNAYKTTKYGNGFVKKLLISFCTKFFKKIVAFADSLVYNNFCCGMIAVKREVAAR